MLYFIFVNKHLGASWKTSIASNLIEGVSKALAGKDRQVRGEIWQALRREVESNSAYSDYDDEGLLSLLKRFEF